MGLAGALFFQRRLREEVAIDWDRLVRPGPPLVIPLVPLNLGFIRAPLRAARNLPGKITPEIRVKVAECFVNAGTLFKVI